MGPDWQTPTRDVSYLLDTILDHIEPPRPNPGTLQMQISSLDYSSYLGRIAVGRISRGSIEAGQTVAVVKRDGSIQKSVIKELYLFEGLGKEKIKRRAIQAGEICAVPYGISTPVMYYNKDILEAAGVDMTNPPTSWDEFYEVCLQCLESGNLNGMDGFTAFDVTDPGWLFKSMCMQNGCSIVEVSDDGTINPVFNSDEAVEVATYWKQLVDSGIMAAGEHSAAENKFLSGNLAFLVMSSNRISRWTDVDINIGAIEMPYFDTQSVALGGNVLVIFTQDEQKIEAAWDLISYLLSPENNLDFALSTGYLPVRQSELETEEAAAAIEENEMYSVAFNQLSYAWAYVHFEQMGTMDLQIADALSRIEKGTREPQEALDKALEKLVSEMEFDAE